MKKIFFATALILLTVLTVYSQATFKPAVGISLNDYSQTSTGEAKAKVGALIGGSVAFGKKLYVEPGVFYTTKSSAFSYSTAQNSSIDADAIIKGIRVPVAIGFGVLGNKKSLMSLRAFGGGSGFFVTGVGDYPVKDNVISPAWGVFLGAGADFWRMFAELSYEWSVTDASTANSNIDFGKSRTLFFTVGLKF